MRRDKNLKRWTEKEIKYLKEHWNKKNIQEIADSLEKSYKSVYQKARLLKLGPNMKNKRYWSKEEEIYLEENWGTLSVDTLAKNLNRSKNAILVRVSRLGLGPFLEAGEYITLNRLMNEVCGTYVGKTYTINQWLDKGLPVKRRKVKNCSFKIIYLQDWWKWAEKNRTILDFSELEPHILGKEPDWVEEQRNIDKRKRSQFKISHWTKTEDNLLMQLLNTYKYTYRDLSLRLQRTEGAIKRRVLDLNIKQRPVAMPKHNPWSEEDTKRLIELYHKGHCKNTMANYIDRSSQAIGGKIERLIKEGILAPRSEYRKSC